MKQKLLILSLAFFTLMSFTTVMHQDHVKVNTINSTVKWKGSKVTSSHEGNIKLSSGKLILEHGKLVGGEFEIDMTTIVNTDIEDKEYRQKLEGHLKNEDFFNVNEFKTASLIITTVKLIEESSYELQANLTIKGITHEIKFNADVKIKGTAFLAIAKIKIDRTKWDIKYNSGSFFDGLGDYLILDEIEFDVYLLSVK
jgi:polyisoprenoid-binding protein YceI